MRVRIAHFSDPHFWSLPSTWRVLLDKRGLGCLNYLLRRRRHFRADRVEQAAARIATLSPDWVVCTGDLTCTGAPEEFEAACHALKPLLSKGLRGIVYVPGNHDAYVRDDACREALAHTCSLLNDGHGLDSFPREVTDRGLHMLLLNEAAPCAPWLSSGHLPAAAGQWLEARLAQPRREGEGRVVIGHFPLRHADGQQLPGRRGLAGAAPLVRAAENGAYDVALCGHIHRAFRRDDPHVIELCAGSLTLEGKINVLDFFPDSCTFSQFWLDVSDDQPAPVLAGEQLSASSTQ